MSGKRRPFQPEEGGIYENHGGGTFCCLGKIRKGPLGWAATFQNTKSGWTFQANGIHGYPDGSIDWNFSTGGHFQEGKPRSITGGQNG